MDKLKRLYKQHQTEVDLTVIYLMGIGLCALSIRVAIQKGMIHQIEQSAEALGLTDQLIDHMKTHIYV